MRIKSEHRLILAISSSQYVSHTTSLTNTMKCGGGGGSRRRNIEEEMEREKKNEL